MSVPDDTPVESWNDLPSMLPTEYQNKQRFQRTQYLPTKYTEKYLENALVDTDDLNQRSRDLNPGETRDA